MANIDSSIYFQQQQPTLPNPLAQAAQLSQLQNSGVQNQLAQLNLQRGMRQDQQEQGINNAYAGSLNPDGTINREKLLTNISNNGYGSQIPVIQKNLSDADKARAETTKVIGEVQKQKLGMYRDALSYVDSPQGAVQWLKSQYSDPDLAPLMNSHGPFEQIAAQIPTDPLKFSQWKPQAALGMEKFSELNKPTFQSRNTGGTTDTMQLPGMGGMPTIVSSIHNTQSPDSIASNATTIRGQNLVNQRAIDANQGSDAGFTNDAINNAAARYNIDGTLPATGMGKAGVEARAAILNRAAVLANTSGVSPDDQRIAQIGNKANSAALSKIQQQQTMVGAFEKNFNKNADIALQLSNTTDNTGIPLANKWINAGKRAISGDPNLAAYDASVKATVNEYAKIISGSMGNTASSEGEIKKVNDLLNSAQTPQQVSAVLNLMKRETQNRMQGFEDEKTQLKSSMGGKKLNTAGTESVAVPVSGKPSLSDIFGK